MSVLPRPPRPAARPATATSSVRAPATGASAASAHKAAAIRVHANAVPARQDTVLRELLAPGFRNHDVLPGCEGGLEGLVTAMHWFDDAFSDQRVRVLHALAEGDLVALHVELRARHTGFFRGIAPSGRSFTVREMHMVRFAGDREAEHWVVRDEASFESTLRGL